MFCSKTYAHSANLIAGFDPPNSDRSRDGYVLQQNMRTQQSADLTYQLWYAYVLVQNMHRQKSADQVEAF